MDITSPVTIIERHLGDILSDLLESLKIRFEKAHLPYC
jgi:hypothetical protein